MDEIGTMDYGARQYSPLLGRFLSADSIVPDPGNPQALNRYSYVYNRPLMFTDPSGHRPCEHECTDNPTILRFDIDFDDGWTQADRMVAVDEVGAVGAALLDACSVCAGMEADAVFNLVFGPVLFTMNNTSGYFWSGDNVTRDGRTWANVNGTARRHAGNMSNPDYQGVVSHELGHVFSRLSGHRPRDAVWKSTIVDEKGDFVTGRNSAGSYIRGKGGYKSLNEPDVQDFPKGKYPDGAVDYSEDHADMFLNYTRNSFSSDGAGRARYSFMQTFVGLWVDVKVATSGR